MSDYNRGLANTSNLGFLLARALQRWNEVLYEGFVARGYPDIRPSYGSILLPLFEEEGLQMGELAERAGLSKQTMTTLIRDMREKGLVRRVRDQDDARVYRIYLSGRSRKFREVAEAVLAEMEKDVGERLTGAGSDQLRTSLRALRDLGRTSASPGEHLQEGSHAVRHADDLG